MLNGWWWKDEGKEGLTVKNLSPIFSVFLFSFRMESNWNVLSEQPLERQPQKLMPTLEKIWILNSLVLKVYTFCSYLSWPFVLSTMTTNRTNFLSLMIFNFSSLSVSRYSSKWDANFIFDIWQQNSWSSFVFTSFSTYEAPIFHIKTCVDWLTSRRKWKIKLWHMPSVINNWAILKRERWNRPINNEFSSDDCCVGLILTRFVIFLHFTCFYLAYTREKQRFN